MALKWLKKGVTVPASEEKTETVLSGQSGKNRVVKFIMGPKTASLTLRAYRDTEQVVDFDTNLFTTGVTMLGIDVPLAVGQNFNAGFLDEGAGAATYNVAIGYEEAD